MEVNEVSGQVIDAAVAVHSALGPGLLESAYEAALARELELRGLRCERQVTMPVTYKGVDVEAGYRLDLLVEDSVIVEVKSVEKTAPVHRKQLLTYLRLADKQVGLLINFGLPRIKGGITRLVNRLEESG